MNPHVSIITAVCSLTLLSASANAQDQPWLKDRRYTEGPGIRVGDFELHPGLAAEFGYDSNFPHKEKPEGALRLQVTPSFSFSTLGQERREAAPGPPPSVEFDGRLSLGLNGFFPVGATAYRSRAFDVGAHADANVRILPSRPFSAGVLAAFDRSITPGEDSTGPRNIPRAGAELIWTPGSGLLDWRIGYQFTG